MLQREREARSLTELTHQLGVFGENPLGRLIKILLNSLLVFLLRGLHLADKVNDLSLLFRGRVP